MQRACHAWGSCFGVILKGRALGTIYLDKEFIRKDKAKFGAVIEDFVPLRGGYARKRFL